MHNRLLILSGDEGNPHHGPSSGPCITVLTCVLSALRGPTSDDPVQLIFFGSTDQNASLSTPLLLTYVLQVLQCCGLE